MSSAEDTTKIRKDFMCTMGMRTFFQKFLGHPIRTAECAELPVARIAGQVIPVSP